MMSPTMNAFQKTLFGFARSRGVDTDNLPFEFPRKIKLSPPVHFIVWQESIPNDSISTDLNPEVTPRVASSGESIP